MNLVIMTKSNPYCWAIMPMMAKAVRDFSSEHTSGATDMSAARFEAAFGLGSNEMFGVAIIDENGHLAGHVLAGIETYLGRSVCMIYQFNKTSGSDEDWRELNKSVQALVDQWCHTLGLPEIMAMAETKSRGRLFRQFGYSEGPVLMRRRFE